MYVLEAGVGLTVVVVLRRSPASVCNGLGQVVSLVGWKCGEVQTKLGRFPGWLYSRKGL